ncbi:KH domain-containing protein [Candidatus Dependentiae bacterium]|nr:KH domain-containing protein [Candidatus Dependentiae bacterium]
MLKEFVTYIIEHLVDDKSAVVVTQRQEGERYLIEVHVASQDLGKVIGKGGATIRSIRAVASLVAAQQGYELAIEVAQ